MSELQAHDLIDSVLSSTRSKRAEEGAAVERTVSTLQRATYTEFLRQASNGWPDRKALVHEKKSFTYRELFQRVESAKAVLGSHGLEAGQPVAILLANTDSYIVWYLAILDLGAVAVPLNTKLVAREIAFIIGDSGAELVVSEDAFAQRLDDVDRERGSGTKRLIINEFALAPTAGGENLQSPTVSPSDPAAVYYTSGTTGKPKGVVHTHQTLIASALQTPSAWEYGDLDDLVALAITPLFHIAIHSVFLPVLSLGGTLVVDTYQTERTLQLIREHGVTSLFAVPSMLLMMIDKAAESGQNLPSIQSLHFGASPMPVHKLEEVRNLAPNARLVHGFGQTESGGTLITLPSSLAFECAGSVGIAMPGVEVAIIDNSGRSVPQGQVGEIVARGPNVMKEYFNNESATAETLDSGFLHTGDLGYLDERGLVFVVDRKKDMIIRAGENIYCPEIEEVLIMHPGIQQAAVVGKPDDLFGEQVCAFLSLKEGSEELTPEEIKAFCQERLASYKIPTDWRMLDELPATATGKIQKGELRKLVQGGG